MSDTAQGPGWWQASDGKWYAPELHPSVRDQLEVQSPQASPPPGPWPGQQGPPARTWPAQIGPAGPAGVPPWSPSGQAPQWDSWATPGATQAPGEPIAFAQKTPAWRRPPVIAAVVIVVAAVAVPLVLRSSGPTGPTLSSLPASAILAKSLAAVRSVHSVEIVDSTTNGTQSTTETVDAGPTGGSVRSSDGGSTSDFELAGNAVYVRGAVDALVNLGVATGVAHRYVDRWVSSPAGSLPGISTVRALLEDRTWLAVLSLTHVAKFTERPLYVSVTGTMPSSALLPAGATRTKATLTISTSAPYWPQSMYFSTSGLLSTLTFSHWGRAPASTTPVGATPLAALVADSASGTAAERAILQAISLRPSDGPSGSSVQLEVDGNQVEGQVTLDLCSQRFASERFRVARRQVTLAGVGNGGMGTEAVVYANGAATATAFAELRHAAATCPDRYVVPPEGPPVWKTTLGPPPDLTWQAVSGVQRLAFDETVSIKGEPAAGGVNVYLRRGRVLLALYFDGVKRLGVPIDGLRSVEGITQMFEERLAALPASAVG